MFFFSAAMAAGAFVDLEVGRIASAMGDAGVSCLMFSLMNQFPLVRALLASPETDKTTSKDAIRREAERLREAHPWSERVAAAGWTLFLSSMALRILGVD